MSLRSISTLFKCREKNWELEDGDVRVRVFLRGMEEEDVLQKQIDLVINSFHFSCVPPWYCSLLINFLSLVFSCKREHSVSATVKSAKNIHEVLYFCCCIKHSKKRPTKCSSFLITPCTASDQVVKSSNVQGTRKLS